LLLFKRSLGVIFKRENKEATPTTYTEQKRVGYPVASLVGYPFCRHRNPL
ncbi:hypothetical protein EVA_08440, partial [gut metagenome]